MESTFECITSVQKFSLTGTTLVTCKSTRARAHTHTFPLYIIILQSQSFSTPVATCLKFSNQAISHSHNSSRLWNDLPSEFRRFLIPSSSLSIGNHTPLYHLPWTLALQIALTATLRPLIPLATGPGPPLNYLWTTPLIRPIVRE